MKNDLDFFRKFRIEDISQNFKIFKQYVYFNVT